MDSDGGGGGERRYSTTDIAPEDVYRALARMQNWNEDLEFMIDDSLAAKEHGSLSLFSGALRNRTDNVKRKLKMLKILGRNAGKQAAAGQPSGAPQICGPSGGAQTPDPAGSSAMVPAAQPGAATPEPRMNWAGTAQVSAPSALPDVRGGGAGRAPKRPLVNIGALCSQLRREQQLLLEGPPAPGSLAATHPPPPAPGGGAHPPAVARALLVATTAPGGPHGGGPGALLPQRITARKLRPVNRDQQVVGLRERPPDPVVMGKVNYDALLREQREMNKRRLEGERVYEELMDKFEAYQAKLLQLLPHQSVFGNRLTDDLAQELDRPTEQIDVQRHADRWEPTSPVRAH